MLSRFEFLIFRAISYWKSLFLLRCAECRKEPVVDRRLSDGKWFIHCCADNWTNEYHDFEGAMREWNRLYGERLKDLQC